LFALLIRQLRDRVFSGYPIGACLLDSLIDRLQFHVCVRSGNNAAVTASTTAPCKEQDGGKY
jgi:hypothetical protein